MGKAGKALKDVLAEYGIRQRRLALAMGVEPSLVASWVDETSDPPLDASDSLLMVLLHLEVLNPESADAFRRKLGPDDEGEAGAMVLRN